jgi:hypothetical protein
MVSPEFITRIQKGDDDDATTDVRAVGVLRRAYPARR